MFCKHCGKEIANDAAFCAHCGGRTQDGPAAQPTYQAPAQPVYQAPAQPVYPQVDPNDRPSAGMAVLGFFIPILGIILWAVNQNTKPREAKSCLNGAITGIVTSVAFSVLYVIFVIVLAAATTPF